MTGSGQDFARGFRFLWRHRGFSSLLILTMAVGIGSLTAVFSVMSAVLLDPLPYPEVNRLVSVQLIHPEHGANLLIDSPVFREMADRSRTLEKLSAIIDSDLRLAAGDEFFQAKAALVSPSFFDLMGARAAVGRLFARSDGQPGSPPITVLSHQTWKTRFSGDPTIIGKSVRFGGAGLGTADDDGPDLLTIVGVLPPEFKAPFSKLDPQVWIADSFGGGLAASSPFALVFGRLRSGTDQTEATDELQKVFADAERSQGPRSRWQARLVPLREFISGKSRRPVELLFLGGLLVFLIAGANTANLLVARAAARSEEAALRQAIGAGRTRVLAQLVAEGLPAALFSGTFGLTLAFVALGVFRSRNMLGLPERFDVAIDWRAGLVVMLLVLATGFLFGLAPALRFWRLRPIDAVDGLRAASPGATRRGHGRLAMLSFQLAVALTVTIACTLLVESFLRIQQVDPGFKKEALLTAWLRPDDAYYSDPGIRASFYQRVLERVESIPDASAAGLVNYLPLSGRSGAMEFQVEHPENGAAGRSAVIQTRAISPGYLQAMKVPLREGRYFRKADLMTQPILVSQRAARELWGDRDPLGQRLKLGGSDRNPWMPVVGIVADVRDESLTRDAQPTIYIPLLQFSPMALVVRSRSGETEHLAATLRRKVQEIDPQQVLADMEPMVRRVDADMTQARLAAWLMGALSLVALLLSAVGVYGTAWFMVSERQRELGIRYAVGASPRGLLRAVASKVLPWIVVGLVTGSVVGLLVSRLMTALLYEVEPTSPGVLGTTVLLMAGVAAAGAYFPGRRAMQLDTAQFLRR